MGCNNCPKKSMGLGDSIEKAIYAVSAGKIKSCEGCKKRKDFLNKAFPYTQKETNKNKVRQFIDYIKSESINESPVEEAENEVPD